MTVLVVLLLIALAAVMVHGLWLFDRLEEERPDDLRERR